jgi:transposase InsO family protein
MEYKKFKWQNELLYYRGLLYVPDGSARLKVLEHCHDNYLAGHFGIHKTLALVSRSFWWPQIRQFVEDYVRTCDTCCRMKMPRHQPYGLLHPLPIPNRPWQSISLDFISDLPVSNGFDTILTVVDRFTKMAHFLPCTKDINSEGTADLLMREVFRHHGLPDNIISDRGPQFVSKFWRHLLSLLKVSCNLSSSYHPQTDGQTERTNQTLEQYLRCFINYQQDDWASILHFAEFAYNNSVHSSTTVTPFFAYCGQHPRWTFLELPPSPGNPHAEERLSRIRQIHHEVSTHLQTALASHQKSANRHRLPHTFRIGDRVWLLRRNVKTTRPCAKLDYQRLGPFVISAQINDVAYRLDLPSHLRLHPVFHCSLLEPCITSAIPNRVRPPPPPVQLLDGPEYEVAAILDSKFSHGKLYYLVDWLGYGPNDRTWEPPDHLLNAQDLVLAYHQQYPHKPGPATQPIPTRSTRRLRRGMVS